MDQKTKFVLLIATIVLALTLVCGGVNSACYSNYEGCDATAHVIQTASAAAATARAE